MQPLTAFLPRLLARRTQSRKAAAGIWTGAAPQSPPQFGGYLRTGNAGGEEAEPRFLVTGALGQIGQELVLLLRQLYGLDSVIASDLNTTRFTENGPYVCCDVLDKDNLARIVLEHGITHVCHLATLLSAIGEKNPQLALKVNTAGIQNVLELASAHNLSVYSPSTIAVFGLTTPKVQTPDLTVMRPTTIYGITKVHQELLGEYYCAKLGVDYRSLRLPGVVSSKTMPGGGTTDFAVEIFHAALSKGVYDCFLAEHTALPFMYMPDVLAATHELIMAPASQLTKRTYNITAMTFTPAQLTAAIQQHLPGFHTRYLPDFRETIAQTWPQSIDDSPARADWGWQPAYDLQAMTKDMLDALDRQLSTGGRQPMHTFASSAAAVP